ncbi:MAG TPA: TIGR02587 family membrane protein [Pyrinomonadaceae bacterium]|jgi:putative integral membrane protein (TIGR02587 family)|nr:TIGR02587 family membrane protein [Pyrinomonadaceae bacterium]
MSLEATQPSSGGRAVAESLQEYGRGVAGGLVFSLPLLYTMEVWWAGFNARPSHLILYVVATFVLLLGYNRYVGLRHDASMTEVVIDSIEEMGIGLVLSVSVLWLIGRLSSDMPANEIVSKVVIEAMTVAVGVSVGTAQLGGENQVNEGVSSGDSQKQDGKAGSERAEENSDDYGDNAGGGESQKEIGFGGQLVIAACGAVLFAANVAPTEEIVVIAAETSSRRLLALALFSLVLSALILYFSEFTGARQLVRVGSPVAIIGGTMMTYAVALVVSALILLFFGRFDGEALNMFVAQTVVLGVAAALGASAGRLLLQQ